MKDPSPESRVDALVKSMRKKPSTSHAVAKNPDLAKAVVRTLDLIQDGTLHLSLKKFYASKMKAAFDGPSYDAVRNYCQEVLKRDTQTGKPLSDD